MIFFFVGLESVFWYCCNLVYEWRRPAFGVVRGPLTARFDNTCQRQHRYQPRGHDAFCLTVSLVRKGLPIAVLGVNGKGKEDAWIPCLIFGHVIGKGFTTQQTGRRKDSATIRVL